MKAAQYGRGENLHYYYNHSGIYNTSRVIIFFICNHSLNLQIFSRIILQFLGDI